MKLDGYSIVDKNIITFSDELALDSADQVQPNGVDLTVKAIYRVHGKVVVPREGKVKAEMLVQPLEMKDGYWVIEHRSQEMYFVDFFETIYVPDGYVADLKTRSSLVRAGIDVVCGLWDTGFKGQLGCCLRVHNDVTLEYGARLCQLVVDEAQFRGARYTGRYLNTTSQTAITENLNVA